MVATVELEIPAKRPCVPLPPLEAFADSPSALRLVAVPPPMGDWHVTAVRLSVVMPSGQAHGLAAVHEANAWIVTIPACAAPGEVRGGWTVYADGVDENGAAFANLALGRGDVNVIPADGAIAPGEEVRFMHLVYERPDSPREGDVFQSTDGWEIYKGGAWIPLGGGTTDYNNLENKPRINSVTLSGNKTAAQLGLATAEEVSELAGEVIAKYTKPQEGIPASDMTQAVQASLGKAATAVQKAGDTMTGGLTVPNLTVGSRTEGSIIGEHSTAEGYEITASGEGSHAEGNGTTASGYNSHAEGNTTEASGSVSHAEGAYTTASNFATHAEGNATEASGYCSHAEGNTTKAQNTAEHAQGQFNASHTASDTFGNAGNTLSSIGFGADDSNRKNAIEVMQDGKIFIYGAGDYDGTNPTGQPNAATDLAEVINGLAPLASPAFTGTPTAPTPTQSDSSGKVATTEFVRYNMPAAVALVAENDAATLVCADRAVTNATIAAGFSTLNLTFPEAINGKVRDFYLRIVVAAGQSAPALSIPQGITIENPDGDIPEIADGEASAAATTLVWFSETTANVFTAKSETVKAVA